MNPGRFETGAAVVAALMVAALVAMIGAALLLAQETWLAQIHHRRDRQAAQQAINAALHWARATLYDDKQRGDADHLAEGWAQSLPPLDFEDARLSGQIEDAQSRFNLNSLAPDGRADADAIAAYQRLLGHLGLPETLAQATADWVDGNSDTRPPGGAENDYYLALPKPRRAADAALIDVDELLWVRGYTPATLAILRAYVIALPSLEAVNVNTASAEVVAALTGLSMTEARQFVVRRDIDPVNQVADINKRLPPGPFTARARLDVGSSYFIARGRVRKGTTQLRMTALLQRQAPGKSWPRIVWQRLE